MSNENMLKTIVYFVFRWAAWSAMGCFGSPGGKSSEDDAKTQKRRSDAITKQLQKDKQVCYIF